MAVKKVTLKEFNGTDYDELRPETEWGQIQDKPTTFTPTAHLLNDHTDVNAVPTANGQVLTWDADNSIWVASTTAGGGVSKADLQNVYIYGKASAAITIGQAVQFDGAQGDHILMKPAVQSEINTNPDYVIGIAETTLAENDFGYVLVNGRLTLDTTGYTAGSILYFDSGGSTAGALTATEPTEPNAIIQLAAVSIGGNGNGEFVVRANLITRNIHEINGLQGELDGKLSKTYRNNWTTVNYGSLGVGYWQKIATITFVNAYSHYNFEFDWVTRGDSGTANVHIRTTNVGTTPQVVDAWISSVGNTGLYILDASHLRQKVVGDKVEIYNYVPAWTTFNIILKDSVTEAAPSSIVVHTDFLTAQTTTEPTGTTNFQDRRVWNKSNLTPSDYVAKAGDTMTGQLIIDNEGGTTPNFIIQGDGEQTFRFNNTATTGSTRTSWKMADRVNTDWRWILYNDIAGDGTESFQIRGRDTGVAFHANPTGIGIGTDNPSKKLHIVGDARIEGDLTVNGTYTQIDTDTQTTEQWIVTNDGTGPAAIINQTGAQPVIDIQDDGVSAFYIEDGGNVGIGTTDPAEKLDVNGRVNSTGYLLAGKNVHTPRLFEVDLGGTGARWYKIATVNKGSGGLTLRGTLNNHVESFGTQSMDLHIYGREGNNGALISVDGSFNVAFSNVGVRVIKINANSPWSEYDVYIKTIDYTQAKIDVINYGNTTVHSFDDVVTTEPTGLAVEFDNTATGEGSYTVVASSIYTNWHSGNAADADDKVSKIGDSMSGTLTINNSASSAFSATSSGARTATLTAASVNNYTTSSTANVTRTGLRVSSVNTWNGTNAVSRALLVQSTGGTINRAIEVESGISIFQDNVGIGTTDPKQKLQVNGDIVVDRDATGSGATITLANGSEVAGNYSSLMFGNVNDHTNYRKGGIAYRTDGTGYGRGDIYFLQDPNADSSNADLSDAAMVILNNKNVGIGTTSPPYKFSVAGVSSSDGQILFQSATSRYMNNDPRWDGDLGRMHIWATKADGTTYGQAGLALWDGDSYNYIDSIGNEIRINGNGVITAGNIGSQSVNYATSAGSAGSASTAGTSNYVGTTRDTPDNSLQYWQAYGLGITEAPTGDWYNTIRMGHGSPLSYYSNTLAVKMTGSNTGDIYTQTIANGTRQGWRRHWSDANDGSGSGLDADLLDGAHATSFVPLTSFSDFVDGTLVRTSIDYSQWSGDSFQFEIEGKSYGQLYPWMVRGQGYIYNDTIINQGIVDYTGNFNIEALKAFNLNGVLCFWWPRQSYWNSFAVKVYQSTGAAPVYNRVTSIENSVIPAGRTKEVGFNTLRLITSGSIGSQSVNYANSAGSATSSGVTNRISINDVRNTNKTPNQYDSFKVTTEFNNLGLGGATWNSIITVKGWDNPYGAWQLASYASATESRNNLFFRTGDNTTWDSWHTIWHTGNFALNATSSQQGGVKMRVDSTTLYIRNDGTNA